MREKQFAQIVQRLIWIRNEKRSCRPRWSAFTHYRQITHYQRSPCFGMRFVAGAGCRGFAPAPLGFIAWCLSRCWARSGKRMKGGCRSIPLIDRSRPLSRRSGCFPLPYPPLSSGSFYCGGIKKRIFAVGSEGMTLKPWGKVVQAKNHLSPQGGTQHAE
jgi:hypothetical protein